MKSIMFTILCLFASVMVGYSEGLKGNDRIPSSMRGKYIPETDYAVYSRSLSTVNFTCTFAPEDCNNNGVCNQEGTACICDDDYATYDATAETGECNYKRKSGLVALLLSIFTGYTGSVYFYVGDTEMGLIQFFLAGIGGIILLAVIGGCTVGCCCGGGGDAETGGTTLFSFLIVCEVLAAVIFWWVVLAYVAEGKIDDSNGVGLSPI